MKYQLRDYQKAAADAAVNRLTMKMKNDRNGLLILPTGCHAKGTPILMYDGMLKNVEDVRCGDLVMGDDGTPRKVLTLHHGEDDIFRITPNKGDSFDVNGGHILSLYKTNEGRNYPSCLPRVDEISVLEYIGKSATYKHVHKLHKPELLTFGNEKTKMYEPYLLGLYLGDGSSVNNSFSITTMREEVVSYICNFAEQNGCDVRVSTKNDGTNKAKSYFLTNGGSRSKANQVIEWIRDLGLYKLTSGDKFIPHDYKTASVEDRYMLLAGLLDTDAYYDKNRNIFEYCSKSRRLAEDVAFVSRSLGFQATIGKTKVVKGVEYYRLNIAGNLNMIPTKVSIRKGHARMQKKSPLVTGFKVESVGKGWYYGFTLDGNHLYCDGQMFIHHNSGKSLVIADIAARIDSPLLVFQPNKEILEQNFAKLQSYGVFDCDVYSASVGRKMIARITFATIGSVMRHMEDFKHFKYILIDECHLVGTSDDCMYGKFFEAADRRIVGLTATPYRLTRNMDGSILKFLTRTRPRVFQDVLYYCQVNDLLVKGFLTKLKYYDLTRLDLTRVAKNSTGADYNDKSLSAEFERVNLHNYTVGMVKRVMQPKSGIPRRGILVFVKFVEQAERMVKEIPFSAVVSGETPKREREDILAKFKAGIIKVVVNVGTLTTGFDYPELDTAIIARPTMSLSLWYQMVGRVIRPCPGKDGWIIDLGGNLRRFGKVEDLRIEQPEKNKWCIKSHGRQLTNVML